MKRFDLLPCIVILLLLQGRMVIAQPILIEPDFEMLSPDDDAGSFGISVGIGSDAIVVGAMNDRRAFVFDRETGEERFELIPDGGPGGPTNVEISQFGSDVAVWGDLALVGARSASNTVGDNTFFGAGFIFDTRTGQQVHRLLAGQESLADLSLIGATVTMNDKYAVLGDTRGWAFVFDVNSGEELHRFMPETLAGVESNSYSDVELSGELLALGAVPAATDGLHDPAVFVFDLSTGEQVVKIKYDLGPSVAASIEIAPDRVFVHSNSMLSSFDFNGDLITSVEVPEYESGTERGMAYSDDLLAIAGGKIVVDAESLERVFLPTEGGATVAMFRDQMVIGRITVNDRMVFSYTVPEPNGCQSLFAILLFTVAMNRRIR